MVDGDAALEQRQHLRELRQLLRTGLRVQPENKQLENSHHLEVGR